MNSFIRKIYFQTQKIPLIKVLARSAAERYRKRKISQIDAVGDVSKTLQELVARVEFIDHQITVLMEYVREKKL